MECFGAVWAPTGLSYFTASTCIVITILASMGNGLIILVVIKDPLKKLSSPFNYFLVNLAASDFLTGAITMPIAVAIHFQEATGYIHPNFVAALHFTLFVTLTSTLLSLIALSVDRYFAVVKAFEYRQCLSWKRCRTVSAIIWVVSLSSATTYFKLGYIHFLMFYICSSVLTGLVITMFVCIKIGKYLRTQTESMKRVMNLDTEASKMFEANRIQNQKAVTRTFMIIMIAFLMIYIPVVVMVFTLQFCEQCDCTLRHSLRDLQALLTAFNSVVNPFVYTIRSKVYLKSIKRLLGKGKTTIKTKPSSNAKTENSSKL